MTITLLIEDSPYGFIAFLHANFPQMMRNHLRLRELAMQHRKLGKFRHLYRYKGTKTRANDKINSYLFLLCRVQSPYVKVEKKSDSQKKNRFFLRYVNYVHYDTLTLRKRKLKKLTTNSHGWT